MTVITGERCNLRSVESKDIDTILLWENDPEVRDAGTPEKTFTRIDIERFVGRQRFGLAANGQQRLMIETKDGRSVGAADLFDYDGSSAGIGILVYSREDRRKGFASEALRLLTEYAAETGLERLYARTRQDNTACRRLFAGAGFESRTGEDGTISFSLDLRRRRQPGK